MIKAKPLALAQKLKNIVDICEAADTEIENQKLIQKGALDAGKENDGIEPAVVRKILARRKKIAKDPAETTRLEDLMTDYQFMLGEGRQDTRPWTQADDEVSRVMALTNTSKPPKIEAIKKALGCSQGKAHKLRSIAAVRLAKKSSGSFDEREHEHLREKGEEAEASTPGAALPLERVESQATTEHSTQPPKPEDGDDGITEFPAGPAEGAVDQQIAAQQDPQVVRIQPTATPVPEGREGTGTHSNEAPATPSVGAEAEGRASSYTDDDLTIPAHLRGASPANRSLRA